MRFIKLLALPLVFGAIGTGCATRMPLHTDAAAPDFSKKGIVVARLHVRNDNRTSQQPDLFMVKTMVQGKRVNWTEPALIANKDKDGKEYFASMDVEGGSVQIGDAIFFRRVFPIIHASAVAPFNTTVDVPAGKVVYVGSIDAIIVAAPQISAKPKAGPLLPILDQKVAGFSDGEWQLTVKDNFDADVAELKAKFPFLSGAEFVKSILRIPDAETQPAPAEEKAAAPAS